VITEQTRKALSDAQRVRSRLQQIYMDVQGGELREAVNLVHSHAQPFLDDVLAWLRSNGYARTPPG
jgi:DNA-binding protein Fis